MMRKFLLAVLAISACQVHAQSLPVYLDDSQPLEQRIEDALSRMTLDEKIAVIHAQSQFSSAGVKRLGFPDFWTSDGPHGIRPDVMWAKWTQAGHTNDSVVAFPALTCLAATWNPSLAYLYGKSLGEEALYRGKNMVLGPGVNINRTPLGGRNFEYMGEDPYLSSTMVVPYIQGMQSNGVASCVKHYALNNEEEHRYNVNVIVSDRALHEIYLPAFKAAVTKGHVWAVMGSYNMYKNQHNCHNAILINQILKGDWKFDGVLISDWGGTHDSGQAVLNGLDMEFGTTSPQWDNSDTQHFNNYFLAQPYKSGILSGKYTMKSLDDKVRRVLRLYYRTTMNRHRPYGFLCSDAHYEAARKIGDEGVVLLKNDHNLLPIDTNKVRRLLVVGENAIKMMTVGGGSSSLKAQREITLLEGLKRAMPHVQIDYERGYVGDPNGEFDGVSSNQDLKEHRSAQQLIADAVNKAREADYVIFVGGLNKSDYQDCEGHDRKSYDMPYGQDNVVEGLLKANKNLVFVNISGNAVAMKWADKVPAIVQGWYVGSEAGEVIADVLTGKVNPSGKLPYTWPRSLNDVGAHALGTYPGTWREGPHDDTNVIDETYKDDIYVGYRWVDHAHTKPLFAFGHGLSYTTFKMSNLHLSASSINADDSVRVSVSVKNTGKRAGAEVVQLYVNDVKSSLPRPYKELKGFSKVMLQPGEQKEVTITLGKDAFSFYDDSNQQWRAESGDFYILVGDASDNLPLKAKLTLK